jgi:hypothetical protein
VLFRSPADRPTLIRRATFGLLGLPPTPAEVAAFEFDPAPTAEAFVKIVDRLLDSPHYGERWGRYWLDVARYADNKGYVFFEEQSYPWAYAYRDWVVRAFNEDLPYDRFLVEQLAADQLPLAADRRSLAALGFLTVGGHFMNNVHDIFDDRIDVVTRGLLGLTVTCARCHDHKYDPIGQADYYSLYGVFRSATEPIVPPRIEPMPATEAFEYYELGLAERTLRLEKFLAQKHSELVSGARTRVAEYLLAAHASRDQPTTEDFMLLIPAGDVHPVVVQRYWHYLQKTRRQHDPVWAVWHTLAAIPETEFAATAPAVCSKLATGSDPEKLHNPLVVEAVCAKPPASMKEVAERYAELLNRVEKECGVRNAECGVEATAGGVRTNPAPTKPAPNSALPIPNSALQQLRLVFHAPDAPANFPMVTGWGALTLLPDRESQAVYQKLLKDLEQWMIHGPEAPPRAMVLIDEPTPFEPRIFLRGNPNRLGDQVPRQFVKVLDKSSRPFSRGSGRLELAQAIADPQNPLTARVFVNRVWMHHFGSGLVKTPADFGVRSDPPSHPELLDSLAATFVSNGWSVKKLHRLIMLSAVYQQASGGRIQDSGFGIQEKTDRQESGVRGQGTRSSTLASSCQSPELHDPENRWLWRFPRRRLDFEGLRDSLLSAAGTLDRTVGGPPVNLLAGSNRRTIYGFVDRLALPGLLRTFDFPSPESTSPKRDETTVAPQALYLMNGPFAQECAKELALRLDVTGETNVARRVAHMHRLLFARPPTDDELRLAAEFLGLTTDGTIESLRALSVLPEQATAWERYAQALLLTNEFAFVD